MALRWWPLALAGLAALIAVVVAAIVLRPRAIDHLRRLAHVDRLTALPEYQRLRRVRSALAVAVLALTVLVFGTAVLSAARPAGWGADSARLRPLDVMLCVGAPVSEPSTAQFLDYFARRDYDVQRIGLTSATARLIPLTRDYQFATERLSAFAAVGDGRPGPQTVAAEFSPTPPYTDYRPNPRDTVALCLAGFPDSSEAAGRRRSLIYLGPAADQSGIVSGDELTDLAEATDVQINVIAAQSGSRGDALRTLTERTGGQYFRYRPGTDGALVDELDTITNHPPSGSGVGARMSVPDTPAPALIAGVALATLLSLARAWWI